MGGTSSISFIPSLGGGWGQSGNLSPLHLINLRLMNGADLWPMCGRGSREGGGSAATAMTYCFKNMNKGKTKGLPLPQGGGDSAGSLLQELLLSQVTSPALLLAERSRVRAGRCPICENQDKGTGLVL